MEQFRQKFIDDAIDLITELESSLLELEISPENQNLIQEIFRIMHTLKGVSSMYGFDMISELTHDLETIYDYIRNGQAKTSQEILNVSLASVDHIRSLLRDPDSENDDNKTNQKTLVEQVLKIIEKLNLKPVEMEEVSEKLSIKEGASYSTYHIVFAPDSSISLRGVNVQAIFEELTEIGQMRSIPRTQPEDVIEKEKKFYMFWEVFLTTDISVDELESIFLFVEDEVTIELIKEEHLLADLNFQKKIEELSETPMLASIEYLIDFAENLSKKKKPEEIIVGVEEAAPKIEEDAIKVKEKLNKVKEKTTEPKEEQQKPSSTGENTIKKINGFTQEHVTSSIKVSSEKLDELMNLVSELVTTKAELNLIAQKEKHLRLETVAEKFDKLSKQFRDNALNIRLIPINHLLATFQRLVRDLSKELDKSVKFTVVGGETELDKTIIDSISNPLMHIIRNSIDHGIEAEEVRLLKGKPAQGNIEFKSYHEGSYVVIKISDDGSGIDLDRIRTKAIEKGFISEFDTPSERELLHLTFTPGFSTAESISEVSGRGVGMDVVKQKISNIRGLVDLETKKDIGTTITIRLPQTLSIIDALLVRIDDTHFLVPLSVVHNCDEELHDNLSKAVNNRIILENELIPFIYLRNEFEIINNVPHYERLVVVKSEERLVALVVDEVVGEHQAVLKPLGEMFAEQELISGASILGDGSVALVLDTNRLIKQFD